MGSLVKRCSLKCYHHVQSAEITMKGQHFPRQCLRPPVFIRGLKIKGRELKSSHSVAQIKQGQQYISGSPPESHHLSERGHSMIAMEASAYYMGWQEVVSNAYNAATNPDGCIQLGLADNQLSYDLLTTKLLQDPAASLPDYAGYLDFKGSLRFRQAMAALLSRVLRSPSPLDPVHVVCCAGATAMVEMLGWCLADPGDAFILPAPYYAGFDVDLGARASVERLIAPCVSSRGFEITSEGLQEAWREGERRKLKVRAVLISSPSNPLGRTLSRMELVTLLAFCRAKKLHLVADEIYAGSTYSAPAFVSVLSCMRAEDAPWVHVLTGLAKDFGIPGFRIGCCYTRNESVLKAVGKMCRFYSPSTHTQAYLMNVLNDDEFLDTYLSTNLARLKARSAECVRALQAVGVSCAPSNAGLFVWADMSHWLRTRDGEGELQLFRSLLSAGVNITPGQASQASDPGWFRICFAGVSREEMLLAIGRIGAVNSAARKL